MPSFADVLASARPDDDRPLDWSIIHPDHRDRLAAAIGDNATQEWIEGMAVTYPADGVLMARTGNGRELVDTSGLDIHVERCQATSEAAQVAKDALGEAKHAYDFARLDHEGAKLARSVAVRDFYRRGETAQRLAGITGLSLPRIQQIVAGARK
jgi:hypothetical protein